MARLYANENFPFPVVEELRRLGHDVLTTLDAGYAGQALADGAVLAFAVAHKRILITLNRKHVIRLNYLSSDHYGIIVCTVDHAFAAQAHRIHEALEASGPLRGKLIRIDRPA
ncbi:MAG TPA: hypothetical protein DCZ69_07160 [Syntrophobacteraceae bacterium]|jgi:hypothetical protein|nr:hypothetical protein [Syntrophobacteraceae bacterium]